jgi:hypothetical protein
MFDAPANDSAAAMGGAAIAVTAAPAINSGATKFNMKLVFAIMIPVYHHDRRSRFLLAAITESLLRPDC